MAELTVAMTYGNALFAAAKDINKADEIKEEIAAVENIFEQEPEYYQLLNNPAVSTTNKKGLIRDVLEGKIAEELLSFLYILIDKGRMSHFDRIVRVYNEAINRDEGFGAGTVYSVVPLSEERISSLEQQIEKLLKEKIKLVNKIDTDLIGGIKILVDGKVIDASLKGRLDRLADQIKNN